MKEYLRSDRYQRWRREYLFKKKHPGEVYVDRLEGNEKWAELDREEMLYNEEREKKAAETKNREGAQD